MTVWLPVWLTVCLCALIKDFELKLYLTYFA